MYDDELQGYRQNKRKNGKLPVRGFQECTQTDQYNTRIVCFPIETSFCSEAFLLMYSL